MKILVVSQYFYPESFRINDLVQTLVARGHEVSVLTGQPNYPEGKLYSNYSQWTNWRQDYCGAKVFRVPLFPRGRGRRIELALNYLSFVASAFLFGLPRIWNQRFDVTFVFATSPITAAIPANFLRFLRGTPLAIWIQDLWPESVVSVKAIRTKPLVNTLGLVVRWIYRRADRLLVPSEAFRESVLKWGGKPEQIRYFPNWAEDIFTSHTETPQHEKFRILFAGNLGHAQGLDTLVAAAQATKLNSQMEWHVMGDGSVKEWLKSQVTFHKLENVQLHDRQPVEAMPNIYRSYDALLILLKDDPILDVVLPSKVQSSMAAGKPLLAAAGTEVRRVINEAQCGLSTFADDATGLAAKAEQLMALAPTERQSMGQRSRSYFEFHYKKRS